MKISWSTAVAIALVGFICFIMYFVIRMNLDKTLEHDLVTEEYYKKELQFEQDLQKEQNADALREPLELVRLEQGLLIRFPDHQNPEAIVAEIKLYRPSNKRLDQLLSVKPTESDFLVADSLLLPGRWDISVEWSYEGTSYLYRKQILY